LSKNKPTIATGHTGTIGKYLSNTIIKPDWNLASPATIKFENYKGVNPNLIHLAGIVGEANVLKDLALAKKINIDGTKILGRKFLEEGEGKFVYISSSHVYGENPGLITEESECNPKSRYAEQKLIAENELKTIFRDDPKRLLILRVFSILDWGMPEQSLGGVIERMATERQGKLNYAADIRDFLTPKKVSKVIEEMSHMKETHGIYNVCSSVGTSVGDAAKKMLKLCGVDQTNFSFENNNSQVPFTLGDNSKISKKIKSIVELKWEPTVKSPKNES
jgi:nucleoside-diphosphate-sugar epimerase